MRCGDGMSERHSSYPGRPFPKPKVQSRVGKASPAYSARQDSSFCWMCLWSKLSGEGSCHLQCLTPRHPYPTMVEEQEQIELSGHSVGPLSPTVWTCF